VADLDGVVFVPQALGAQVLEAAEEKRRAEQALLQAVAGGRSLKDAVESIGTL
jgi:regulator of RNase E activity RraA